MDTTRKTTLVAFVTLLVGVALGLGVGIWGVRSSRASSVPTSSATNPMTSAAKNDKPEASPAETEEWDPFRRMEKMQAEIDRAIRHATEQLELGNSASIFRPDAGYSSQFDLRDRSDHFELRAYLPDAEASDVNVKVDNDRVLHVTVDHRKHEMKKDSAHEARMTELGRYEQVVTLPEAVRSNEMKIERNRHEVIITIPKENKNT
jgi:HSP20 family molecular chaperone IbpA